MSDSWESRPAKKTWQSSQAEGDERSLTSRSRLSSSGVEGRRAGVDQENGAPLPVGSAPVEGGGPSFSTAGHGHGGGIPGGGD
eukprot:CAMPEP_0113559144 /NCGR_PEP_ID=MMETSP0015_2-20120614/18732_1 /TAXON_ID=2838 /ORGANISM="Odontella" /LENGTH=82 /DNA_ID=CAMNT_0000460745 /DNA_START=565 /DNA_END=810 /DNA_ORIENTATION=- /assembly_acc=CAM_ASM_000160